MVTRGVGACQFDSHRRLWWRRAVVAAAFIFPRHVKLITDFIEFYNIYITIGTERTCWRCLDSRYVKIRSIVLVLMTHLFYIIVNCISFYHHVLQELVHYCYEFYLHFIMYIVPCYCIACWLLCTLSEVTNKKRCTISEIFFKIHNILLKDHLKMSTKPQRTYSGSRCRAMVPMRLFLLAAYIHTAR